MMKLNNYWMQFQKDLRKKRKRNILEKLKFSKIIETFDDLYTLLDKSIYENPPITLKEGYLIKSGYNKELDDLKLARSGGKDFIAKLEEKEKELS